MAGPCNVIFKGEEIPYEKFMAMLHDGMLDQFIKDKTIDPAKFEDPSFELNQETQDESIVTPEQRDAILAGSINPISEEAVTSLESQEESAGEVEALEEVIAGADRITADAVGEPPAGKGGERAETAPSEERPRITSGPSHRVLTKLAEDLGFAEPLKGEVLSSKEYVEIGQELLKSGADPEKIRADFEKDNIVNAEMIAVARAHQEVLVKEAENARREFGKDSPEFKEAVAKVEEWVNNVTKPMASEWGRSGRALQGETEVDTGSFVDMERAFEAKTGKKFTPEQEKKAEEYSNEVTDLRNKVTELETKLTEAISKSVEKAVSEKETPVTIKERAQKVADAIRKGKLSRPDVFSSATPGALVWDGALEAAALTVEAGGSIAQAIAKGLQHIRSTEWFQSSNIDTQNKVEEAFTNHFEDVPKLKTPGEKRIDRIQKRIDDLLAGKVKEKKEVKYTPEEQAEIDRLTSELEDLKEQLGLTAPKTPTTPRGTIPASPAAPRATTPASPAAPRATTPASPTTPRATTPKPPKITKTPAQKLLELQQDLQNRFQNKTDKKFDPDDAYDLWDYAKRQYIDQGASIEDTFQNTARDLGLTPDQVRSAVASDKSVRTISDQMYVTQNKRRLVERAAKSWLESADNSKVRKFLGSLPDYYFGLKTFGHGTVGAQTHAGLNIFKPSQWKHYWPFFFDQFKYAFGGTTKEGRARYEQAMTDLENHPDFLFWKRAKLAIDPNVLYTEYETLGKKFQSVFQMGERGFNALKPYRLNLAKQMYDGLSAAEKADKNTAKKIAELVNNSTGTTTTVKPGAWTGTVFFAPKLEISRWKRIVTNPAKAATTFVNWKKATPAEKAAAKYTAKNAGETMAVYAALIAANAALNAYAGDDENKVNLTDPTKSDFLKFKAGGKTLDLSGGILSTMRFIATLINQSRIAYTEATEKAKGMPRTPQEVDYQTIMQQIRGKASPFSGLVADLMTGVNGVGKPLPFSDVKPRKGQEAYTWKEYAGEAFSPIPISEGLRVVIENMHKRGMTEPDIRDYLNGVAVGIISGGTGAKIGFAPEPKPGEAPSTEEPARRRPRRRFE